MHLEEKKTRQHKNHKEKLRETTKSARDKAEARQQ
jgi:hypothetical protein